MRKVREALWLNGNCEVSERETAASCRISHDTVVDCLRKASAAGLNWTAATGLPEDRESKSQGG